MSGILSAFRDTLKLSFLALVLVWGLLSCGGPEESPLETAPSLIAEEQPAEDSPVPVETPGESEPAFLLGTETPVVTETPLSGDEPEREAESQALVDPEESPVTEPEAEPAPAIETPPPPPPPPPVLRSSKEVLRMESRNPNATARLQEGGATIAFGFPYGVSLENVRVIFQMSGVAAYRGEEPVETDAFWNLTEPRELTIEAQDGSRRTYSLVATVAPNPLSFEGLEILGFEDFDPAVSSDNNSYTYVLPYRTDLRTLRPQFSTSAVSLRALQSGAFQVYRAGEALDFRQPVQLQLGAEDGRVRTINLEVTARAASRDNSLNGLMVEGYALTPAFNPEFTSYSVDVPRNLTEIRLRAIKTHAGASLQVNMNANPQVALNSGETRVLPLNNPDDNNIFVRVLAEDNRTSQYYVILVRRRL